MVMPNVIKHLLKKFPCRRMQLGALLLANDCCLPYAAGDCVSPSCSPVHTGKEAVDGHAALPSRLTFDEEVITNDRATFIDGAVTLGKVTDVLAYEISGSTGAGDPCEQVWEFVQDVRRSGV